MRVIFACDGYRAAGGSKKPGYQVQQRAFSRAAWAENGNLLAPGNREGKAHWQMVIKPGDISQS